MLLKARASTHEGSVSDTLAPSVPHKATAKHHPSASHSQPPSFPLARSSSPLPGPSFRAFLQPGCLPSSHPSSPPNSGSPASPSPASVPESQPFGRLWLFLPGLRCELSFSQPVWVLHVPGVGGTRGVTGFPFPRLRPFLSSTSRAPLLPSGPQCAPRFPRPSRSRHAAKFGPRLPLPAAHTPRPPPGWTRALTPRPGRRGCRRAHRPAPAAAAAGRGGGPAERSLPPNPQRAGAPWGPGRGPRQ